MKKNLRGIRTDDKVWDAIKRIAEKSGRTVGVYVERLVIAEIKRLKEPL